ncbi:alpha-mannosidase [bacterium]|nr:alpha-mannosidase [bacterium]
MHDDRELAERRIERELWGRVLPLVHAERTALAVTAGPTPDDRQPFKVGTEWGAPWGTTWFGLRGEVPDSWRGRHRPTRIEVVIDLGFTRSPAGFQAEGLVVERYPDGTVRPRQGIHPRRTNYVLDDDAVVVDLLVEAASNPTFPQFAPSRQGLPDTASKEPAYRFRTADLVLVDVETEALAHDLDVLAGMMRALAIGDPRRVKLRQAIVSALDAIPDVEAARCALASHLAPTDGPIRRHRIVATGHAHIDTAWLWPIQETIRKCTRTFASAVALMDDDPAYRFSCSQAQQYAWIEERHPDLFAKIGEKVAAGQWVPVGGMWVEADMNLPSGESLARQIVHGQRYFAEKFGAPCREVWIPDVFGYPAGLPQLFAAGGMTRFVTQKLSWNKQNRFPHHTFWWEGLDGSRVLTHFPPVDTYNAEITPGEVAHSVENFKDHRWSDVSLMPFGHGDGGGGPTREMLERAHRLARLDPDATLEIGSPDDYFTAVEREATYGAPVPVWRGELYFEMHRGTLTSQLRTKLGNRRCERELVAAELWEATIGGPLDLRSIEVPTVAELWPDVLTQQFHDILPGSSIAWVHRDAEETFARVHRALAHRTKITLNTIAPAPVSVANPAGVTFSGVVVASLDDGSIAPEDRVAHGRAEDISTSMVDLLDGIPHQLVGNREYVFAVDVPAFGVAGLCPRAVADRVVVTDYSMTNGHLAVRWNKQGEVTSIIDIVSQRELVPDGANAAVLELGRDQPVEYDAWDLESWTREQSRPVGGGVVRVESDGPLLGRVQVTRRFGPSLVVTTYELRAESRQLDIDLHIDWHHDEHLLSMAFPLDVRAETAACDVQFGVTYRPTHPSSPWDAAKFEVCAHRYVSLAEPSFGVAVLNDGRYGHAIFDGSIRISLARAAKYPDPDADHGHHRVRLAVRPHDGDLADVRAAAELLNRPLGFVVGAIGTGVDVEPIITIAAPDGRPVLGVEIDAIKHADDDSGDVIVRLHEAVGDRTRIVVGARAGIGAAWFCDLMEAPQRGEEVGDGVVAITLRPFQLVTLRLRLAPALDGRTVT